ncbi:MAG TPA: hypothetical protein VFI73_12200 [Candidatus Nitrosopolaris sp.]|nr:hypothetical protein [Candidatus Nitrosopolaris sp.]
MRSYSLIIFNSAFILALLTSATFTNAAYSQVIPNQGNSSATTSQQPQSRPNLHLVKITSPTKGQQVPVGKDLLVSGTSVTNKTTDCKVSVKVNFINPYHDASPIGVAGNNDYSKWNFTLSPAYTTIKPGQNKITAKFACANNPTLTSHYSVNVTGIDNVAKVSTASNTTDQQQISSISTPLIRPTAAALNSTTNAITSNAPNSTKSPVSLAATFSPSANSNTLRALSVSIHVGKNSLHPGDKQTLTTTVADKTNSTNLIAGALVSERIVNPSGIYKNLEGTTDDHGKASYSWKVSNHDGSGTYKVIVRVSAPNYEKYSTWKTFRVTYKSTSSTDNSIIRSTSENSKSNSHEQTSNSNVGDVNKIHINPNSLSNLNSGSSISSSSDSNSIGDNHQANAGENIVNQNINGLAQKIINNVKSNLKMHGIHLP